MRFNMPAEEHEVQIEIRRSKFMAILFPVEEEAQFHARLKQSKLDHPKANHHCWAYLIGPPASSARVGMSDDGEPSGTAGRPMLNVLNHCELGNIAVIVVRYFGGVKLGTGGLVRAYSDAVKAALQTLPVSEWLETVTGNCEVPYPLVNTFQVYCDQKKVQILGSEFAESVVFEMAIPKDGLQDFCDNLHFQISWQQAE